MTDFDTPIDCPVCDKDGFETESSLRGHVNGSPDHPSWEEVKGGLPTGSELVDDDDQQATTSSEGGKSPDVDGDRDQSEDSPETTSEGGNEGGGSGPTDPDDQPDDPTDQQNTPMPTEDELVRQRQIQGDEPDESGSDEETSDETTPKGGNEGGSFAGLLPALDTSTVVMFVALLAVVYLTYRLLSGDGDEGDDDTDVDDEEADEEVDGLSSFDATDLEMGGD